MKGRTVGRGQGGQEWHAGRSFRDRAARVG